MSNIELCERRRRLDARTHSCANLFERRLASPEITTYRYTYNYTYSPHLWFRVTVGDAGYLSLEFRASPYYSARSKSYSPTGSDAADSFPAVSLAVTLKQ